MHVSRISSAPYHPHVRRMSRRDIEQLNQVGSIDSGSRVSNIRLIGDDSSRASSYTQNNRHPDDGILVHSKRWTGTLVSRRPWLTFTVSIIAVTLLAASATLLIRYLIPARQTTAVSSSSAATISSTTIVGTSPSTSTLSTTLITSTASTTVITSTISTTASTSTIMTSSTTDTTTQIVITVTSTTTITTTQTTATTTSTPGCIQSSPGSLFNYHKGPNSLTSISRSYTANKMYPTLMFTADVSNGNYYIVDSVSIVDTAFPANELLKNPGFDNATNAFNGWDQWCNTQDVIDITSGCQSGTCIKMIVNGPNGLFRLTQTFLAVIGNTYTVSFVYSYSSNSNAHIHVDIT